MLMASTFPSLFVSFKRFGLSIKRKLHPETLIYCTKFGIGRLQKNEGHKNYLNSLLNKFL